MVGYLNGVLFGIHIGGVSNIGSHDVISIGAKTNGTRYIDGPSAGNGNRFNSQIDEVIVYGQYYDPTDISFDYNASFPVGYYTPNYSSTGSGGLMLGSAARESVILPWSPTGGIILSGSGSSHPAPKFIGSGGLIVSGSATSSSHDGSFVGTGGLIISGHADFGNNLYNFTGSGGLIVGGTNSGTQSTINVSQVFSWNVNANVIITTTVSWSIGQSKMMFYQVVTNCKTQTCPPYNDLNAQCDSRQVMTIPSRSLEDVCTKLKKAGIVSDIASVKRYSNPVFLSDFTEENDLNCNSLEDVTQQFFAVSDCLP
jgi:hypothetical protein